MKKLLVLGVFIFINLYAFAQTYHSGTISNDETWLAADNPHIITGNITIQAPGTGIPAVVTLEAGLEVKFDGNYYINVGSNNANNPGALKSEGTETDSILITSNASTPAPGDWKYIRFYNYAIDDSNHFEYTTFEYGGSSNTMIYLENSSPTFNNCTFRNMNNQAISPHNNSSGAWINNCNFENGNSYPLTCYAKQNHKNGSGNIYSGNTIQAVQVYGEIVSESQFWTTQSIPFRITDYDLTIHGYSSVVSVLTIDSGAILEFETGSDLYIGNNVYSDRIGGVMADNVTFQGAADSAGAWSCVRIRKFSYGDSNRFDNCTFRNASYGIYVDNEASFHVNNSTFTGNSVAASVLANEMYCFEAGNIYTGNTDDRIEVRSDIVSNSAVWTTQATFLHITGNVEIYGYSYINSILTINSGTIMEFDPGIEMIVGNNVYADRLGGVMADNVTFQGVADSAGAWSCVRIRKFSYGDSNRFDNCTFRNASYGIYVDNEASFHVNNSTFTGNSVAASVLANEMYCFETGNIYTGNTDDRIEVRSDVVGNSAVWTTQATSLHITGTVEIYKSDGIPSILTINSGSVLEFDHGIEMRVGNDVYSDRFGGVMADNVTFQGVADSAGAWSCVRIRKYSYGDSNRFDNCTFQNASFGIYVNDEASFHVNNSTFTGNSVAASVLANEMYCFKAGNVYTGNNDDRIEIRSDVVGNSAVWTTQNTPLYITGNVFIYNNNGTSHLEIQDGAELEFAAGKYLQVGSHVYSNKHGSLSATGVVFTGDEQVSGSWNGVQFRRYTDSPNCLLDRCIIEYAGNGNHGNIWCDRTSPLIRECIIRHSSNYGIMTNYSEAVPIITACSIISNDIGVYCGSDSQPTIGGAPGNSNAITGNTTYGVQNVSSGVIVDATYNWWGDVSGPYDPNGTIEVPPCADPANDLNADGLGDNVSDYVDYCTWSEIPLSDAPSLFDLLTPVQADTLWNLIATFDWETAIDPTPDDTVSYKLEISSSAGYEPENTFTIVDLLISQYETIAGDLDDDTHYWWRVTAFDTQDQYTNCNQQDWYFDTYVVEPPNAFNLLSPTNSETVMITSPLMTWEEAIDPDPGDSVIYTVFLDDNAGFTDPDSMETAETGIYPPFCTPGTTYYWKVKATDSFDQITWSDIFNFYVHPDSGPRPPSWITTSIQNHDVLLNWEAVPGADSYDIEQSTEPYSGFDYLDSSSTNNFTHIDAALVFTKSFYRIKAIDNDLILFWRDLLGNRLE